MADERRKKFLRLNLALIAALILGLFADRQIRPKSGWTAHYFNADGSGNENPIFVRYEVPPTDCKFADLRKSLPPKFKVRYLGKVRILYSGTYFFDVAAAEESRLWIDEKPIAGRGAEKDFPMVGATELAPGLHDVKLEYTHDSLTTAPLQLGLMWSKEIDVERPFPASAAYPPDTRQWRFTLSAALRFLLVVDGIALLLGFAVMMMTPRSARRFYFGVATAFLSVCAIVALAEIGLRLAGIGPREYVPGNIWLKYDLKTPGSVTQYMGYLPYNVKDFEVPVRINSKGWRDAEYDEKKPDGVYRILVIGDSYVEGKEVALEKTFHKLLEKKLNATLGGPNRRFEVMALSRGGIGTGIELNYLRDPGLKYSPDMVVLSVFPGNDVRENSPPLNDRYWAWFNGVYRAHVVTARIHFLDVFLRFKWSYLNHFLADRLCDYYVGHLYLFHRGLKKEEMISNDAEVYRRGPYSELWNNAWDYTKNFLREFKGETDARHIPLKVMLSHSAQVSGLNSEDLIRGGKSKYDLQKPFEILSDFLDGEKIEYLNLEPILTRYESQTRKPYYWRHDAHWNETGHAVVADALYDFLFPQLKSENLPHEK